MYVKFNIFLIFMKSMPVKFGIGKANWADLTSVVT